MDPVLFGKVTRTRFQRLFNAIRMLSGLAAYYPLNEITGNAINRAPMNLNTLNGTVSGATRGALGKVGKAYSFDGTDDEVAISGFSGLNREFSIFLLLNQSSYVSGLRCFAVQSRWEVDIESSRYKLRLYGSGGNTFYDLSDTFLPNNKGNSWVLVSASISMANDYVKGYINGVLHKTTNSIRSDLFSSGSGTLNIGRYSAGSFFNGLIQHVGYINRPMTDAEHRKIGRIAGL